jgi:hypothetical protein
VAKRGVGFVELTRGNVRVSNRYECVGTTLRSKRGSRKYKRGDQQETAQHGIDYAAQTVPAASTPADQCVMIKRATTWL